ncbi:MAG: hypothetical protein LDL31_11070, partial [Prosthecobacter sp.]|nr:hypothetical protein [Prosthecobacter sp.]
MHSLPTLRLITSLCFFHALIPLIHAADSPADRSVYYDEPGKRWLELKKGDRGGTLVTVRFAYD